MGDETFPVVEGKSKKEAKERSASNVHKKIKERMKSSIPSEEVLTSLFNKLLMWAEYDNKIIVGNARRGRFKMFHVKPGILPAKNFNVRHTNHKYCFDVFYNLNDFLFK